MVHVIDGMDGVAACYAYAGIVGIRPHGLTMRQLWSMAQGKVRQKRIETLELVNLAWGANIDLEAFVYFGLMESTGQGGPVQLSPEMEAKVAAEVERLRAENPDLPKIVGIK